MPPRASWLVSIEPGWLVALRQRRIEQNRLLRECYGVRRGACFIAAETKATGAAPKARTGMSAPRKGATILFCSFNLFQGVVVFKRAGERESEEKRSARPSRCQRVPLRAGINAWHRHQTTKSGVGIEKRRRKCLGRNTTGPSATVGRQWHTRTRSANGRGKQECSPHEITRSQFLTNRIRIESPRRTSSLPTPRSPTTILGTEWLVPSGEGV